MVRSSKYLVANQGIACTQSYNISINLYSFTTKEKKPTLHLELSGIQLDTRWLYFKLLTSGKLDRIKDVIYIKD